MVCDGPNGDFRSYEVVTTIKNLGGIGLVLITDAYGLAVENFVDFPATFISPKDGISVLQYIKSTR